MSYIEKFLNGEVGIDLKNSTEDDIIKMSALIDFEFPDVIQIDEGDREEERTVFGYWREVNDGEWEIMVYETDEHHLNAYRNETADNFREEFDVFVAREFVEDCKYRNDSFKEVNEDELTSLFEV